MYVKSITSKPWREGGFLVTIVLHESTMKVVQLGASSSAIRGWLVIIPAYPPHHERSSVTEGCKAYARFDYTYHHMTDWLRNSALLGSSCVGRASLGLARRGCFEGREYMEVDGLCRFFARNG